MLVGGIIVSSIQHQCDILVLGGGIAACFAAIKAAEAGAQVIMADKCCSVSYMAFREFTDCTITVRVLLLFGNVATAFWA